MEVSEYYEPGGWGKRFGLRFGFVFALTYGLFEGFRLQILWLRLPTAFMLPQTYVGHRPIPIPIGNVSGNIVMAAVPIIVSLIVGAVWASVDRRNKREWVLAEVATFMARMTLIAAMFGYGFEKVVPLQFPYPGPAELARPLDEWARHEFLWRAWMGISQHYEIFAGIAEVTAGLLLVFRRTITLGALLVFAEMANVAVLNFGSGTSSISDGYELIVGMAEAVFPACYAILSLVILFVDWPRLRALFLRHTSTVPSPRAAPLGWPAWVRIPAGTVWAALVIWAAHNNKETLAMYRDLANLCSLGGVYRVEEFTSPAAAVNPATRWRAVIIDRHCQNLLVRTLEDSTRSYNAPFSFTTVHPDITHRLKARAAELAADRGTLTLMWFDSHLGFDQTPLKYALQYARTGRDNLTLDGALGADTVHAVLHRLPLERYALYNPAFP
jgi:hypothetical protein